MCVPPSDPPAESGSPHAHRSLESAGPALGEGGGEGHNTPGARLQPPRGRSSRAGGGVFDLRGVLFHLLALQAVPHPLSAGRGWPLLGWGPPECLPFPPAPPPASALVEAAAFVSRGAGSSTGPSLAPFVLQMGKPDAAGRGRGIGFLRLPPTEDPRTPPSGPVSRSGASPGDGLPPRALAPGRRGADGGQPGTPPCVRCALLCGRPRVASAQAWRSQPGSLGELPTLE